jgi:NADPH-dependent ferric siderophore reductase
MSTSASTATQAVAAPPADPRSPQRVRHQPRRRMLTIKQAEKIAAHMIRVTLIGDLDGFTSLGFDDHVKLFFPDGTTEGAANMLGRDFTPRHHDPVKNTLAIEFAIHDAGPATRWAAQAQPGQTLSLGGPRGSFIIPTAYDWHLLIADETGLPAIGRRLAELPAGARVIVLGEVDDPADELALATKANATITGPTATAPRPAPTKCWRRRCRDCKCPPAISTPGSPASRSPPRRCAAN